MEGEQKPAMQRSQMLTRTLEERQQRIDQLEQEARELRRRNAALRARADAATAAEQRARVQNARMFDMLVDSGRLTLTASQRTAAEGGSEGGEEESGGDGDSEEM